MEEDNMLALMQLHENGHYVHIHLSEDEDCRDAGEQLKEIAEYDPDVYKLVYVSDLEELKKAMYETVAPTRRRRI